MGVQIDIFVKICFDNFIVFSDLTTHLKKLQKEKNNVMVKYIYNKPKQPILTKWVERQWRKHCPTKHSKLLQGHRDLAY